MKRTSLVGLVAGCALVAGACGDDGGARSGQPPRGTVTSVATEVGPGAPRVDAPVPAELAGGARRSFLAGRELTRQTGCLACHRIGSSGNDGPGNNLTGVGDRRSRSEIRLALLDPRGLMRSYDELPADDLDALVAFLSTLRDTSCPDDGDCG